MPTFFATPAEFRYWLARHHATATELWVGFYRKDSGRQSITWPESVDEALCVGWIDGLRKRVDHDSYMIRFTPRRALSTWSAVNIGRAEDLARQNRMLPAGRQAFARRSDGKSAIYAYEQRKKAVLDKASERQFRANQKAWRFFQAQPPGYRRTAAWWVNTARKEETRQKRLAILIANSEAGIPI